MIIRTLLLFTIITLFACQSAEKADIIIINGKIATVNEEQPEAEAIAFKGDKILAVGTNQDIQSLAGDNTSTIDAKGNFVMPGFIEGHGHFSGLGKGLINLNLLNTKSWQEIVDAVAEKVKEAEPGEWIWGRGWHQEKWTESVQPQVHGYPFHDALSEVSPDNPVLLRHASGHSLFANKKAMETVGISKETPDPVGGEIVRDEEGNAIGVFEENAMDPIQEAYMHYLSSFTKEQQKAYWLKGVELAQKECLAKGVTSFQDAGTRYFELDYYKELAQNEKLDLRLWVMLRHPYDTLKEKGLEGLPVIGLGNNHFTCKAIKSEVDGALGAFGAWLLKPYNDKPDFVGQNTTPISDVKGIAEMAFANNLQLCVHAIGDRANRVVLDIFEEQFQKGEEQEDLRWRIEHAQHLNPKDIPRFKELGVIASMQGIHCTSDAPFVEKRLGEKRSRVGAYPWRSLLDNGVIIANGTDAPVEDVDPIECFYASVTRKRADNGFEFFPEQRMTREEAIHSYTLGNAYAAFEEDLKGSLEPGKLADVVILSKDLRNCSDEEILDTKVLYTIVGGEIKYEK